MPTRSTSSSGARLPGRSEGSGRPGPCYNRAEDEFSKRRRLSAMPREVISTSGAPQAIGPYSQAVKAGNLVFVSGQIPIDPETGEVVGGGIEEQTARVLQNLQAILEAAGASLKDVVRTTVFLADLADFGKMNEVYGRFFPENPPARTTVQAAGLPRGVRVEIDAIAVADRARGT